MNELDDENPPELSSHEEADGALGSGGGLSAADPATTLNLGKMRLEQLTQLKEQMKAQAQMRQAAMERMAQMYEQPINTGMDPGLIALGRGIASRPASEALMGFTEGVQGMQEARQKLAERDWARKASAEKVRAQAEQQNMSDLLNEAKITEHMTQNSGRTYAPRDYVVGGHHMRDTFNPNTGQWVREDLGVAPSGMRGAEKAPTNMEWVDAEDHSKGVQPIKGSKADISSKQSMPITLTPDALDSAAHVYISSGKFPPNMGRGVQGEANSTAVQNRAAEIRRTEGLSSEDMLNAWGIRKGQTGAYADIAKRVNKIDLAVNEGLDSMKITQEMSDKLPRTAFPAVNGGLQFFEKHIGDPNLRAFQSSVNTLVNVYARAVNPTGVATVSDKDHARELLSTVDGPEAFNAVMNVLQREMETAKRSGHRTMLEAEPGYKEKKENKPQGKFKYLGKK